MVHPTPTLTAFPSDTYLRAGSTRRALAGFGLSGFLLALPGAILPAWGHHLDFAFDVVGQYFLGLALGVLASALIAGKLIPKKGASFTLVAACVLASVSLLFLAFAGSPAPAGWRVGGFLLLGIAGGLLQAGLFRAIWGAYQHDPSATASVGGATFGIGCVAIALLVGGAFYDYSVASILATAAFVPLVYAWIYSRTDYPAATLPRLHASREEIRSLPAILLALLLFFQFGNEWAIAGWLSVFLVSRLGISPEASLAMLGLFWATLLTGRLAAIAMLPRVSHGRLLFGGAFAAMFGCVILLATDNRFGAYTAILLIGAGFAPIYPLVAEKIGHRFKHYHPGLFDSIFSVAVVGAMLAPAICGYLANYGGIGMVMALPMTGTVLVLALVLLIWLESKLGG